MEALLFVRVPKKPVKFSSFLCNAFWHFVAVLRRLVVQAGHGNSLQIHSHARQGDDKITITITNYLACCNCYNNNSTLWYLCWGRSSYCLTSSLCWLWLILSESLVLGIIPEIVELQADHDHSPLSVSPDTRWVGPRGPGWSWGDPPSWLCQYDRSAWT